MQTSQRVLTIQIYCTFFEALKVLLPMSVKREFDLVFTKNNSIKVFYQEGQKQRVWKYLQKVKGYLSQINLIKINMSQRKIERLMRMKKWRSQSHDLPGLTIVRVIKKSSSYFYLAAYSTQKKIFEVYCRLLKHSYKTYTSNMRKSVTKHMFQDLIETNEYQTKAYNLLKITSTQIKQTKNLILQKQKQRSDKFLQLQFELDTETSTESFIEKYKLFLAENFEAVGFVIHQAQVASFTLLVKALNPISVSKVSKWKSHKNDQNYCSESGITTTENTLIVFVVLDSESLERFRKTNFNESETLNALCQKIKGIRLLGLIGKLAQKFSNISGNIETHTLSSQVQFLIQEMNIVWKPQKNPTVFDLQRKGQTTKSWKELIPKILQAEN